MNLDWALGFARLDEFETWRAERTRSLDLIGIDAPRSDWTKGSRIHVVVTGQEERETSLLTLREKIYTNWHLHDSPDWLGDAQDDDLGFVLRAGDRLEPHAFACAVDHAARHPS